MRVGRADAVVTVRVRIMMEKMKMGEDDESQYR